jgi:hypothetical protein
VTVLAKMFGVPVELLPRYRPDGQNMFTCVKSGSIIPFEWVNDDFCDCPGIYDFVEKASVFLFKSSNFQKPN